MARQRWLALTLLLAMSVALLWLFVANGLLWAVVGALVVAGLALTTGRPALTRPEDQSGMPVHDAPPPRHPFIVVNPRSGGEKVGRFQLKEKAEALGAEAVLLEGASVHTGVHNPGDVIAGALIGAGIGSLAHHVADRHKPLPHPTRMPGWSRDSRLARARPATSHRGVR